MKLGYLPELAYISQPSADAISLTQGGQQGKNYAISDPCPNACTTTNAGSDVT
jgi:hypothetical protein